MKKITQYNMIALVIILITVLVACGQIDKPQDVVGYDGVLEEQNKEASEEYSYNDMKGTPQVVKLSENKKLEVFEDMTSDSGKFPVAIYVYDADTKDFLQKIDEESKIENCTSSESHLVFEDMNFDDNPDMHFVVDEGEGNIIYSNYVWDSKSQSFSKSDFDTRGGFEVDQENQKIFVYWSDTFFYSGEVASYKWDGEDYVPLMKEEYYLGESEEMPESLIYIYEYDGNEYVKIATNEYDDFYYDGGMEWDFVHSEVIAQDEVDGKQVYTVTKDGVEYTYEIDKDKHLVKKDNK